MAQHQDRALYAPIDPTQAGLKAVCPRCGTGKLFDGTLKFKAGCANCGLDYSAHEVGDGAVVPVMMVANAIALGGALALHSAFSPPIWLHVLIWPPLMIAVVIVLTRLLKGVLIAHQYAKDARQGELVRRDDGSAGAS